MPMHIYLSDEELRAWSEEFPSAVERGLQEAIPQVRSLAEALTPSLTGELAESISVNATRTGLTVRWGAAHAKYAEYGTVAHEIEGSPYLSFFWQGRRAVFRHVHHPGYQGWHFAARMHQALEAIVHVLVENAVMQAQRGVGA